MRHLTAIFALLLLLPDASSADEVAIVNAGFEDQVLGNGAFSFSIPGWTNAGDSGTFNPTTGQFASEAPEGSNVAFSSNAGPVISQVLAAVLDIDTEYTLSVLVGDRLDLPFPGYSVQLLAGGVILAEDNNSMSPVNGDFFESTVTYESSLSDTQIGEALEIRLRGFGQQVNFDDVRLNAVASIPEPSGMVILGLGAAFGCLIRRR
jgi:hypothetical protein